MKRWPALLLLIACHAAAAPLQFDLARLNSEGRLKLSHFPGQPVVLNFWASNCLPCVRELPVLNALAVRQSQLPFIGIAIDTRVAAQAFLRQHPASYPQALASSGLLPIFGNQIKGLPYTVILTSEHQICTRRLGPVDSVWLAAAISACR